MWKSLTILAILVAIAASTLRYFNEKDIAREAKLLERAKANLQSMQDHRAAMVERQNDTEADIEQVTAERDEEEKKSLAAQAKEAQLEDDKKQLEELIAQKEVRLEKLRKDVAEIGEIKDLVEKSENLQAEMATVQQEILIAKENFKKMVATRIETEKTIAFFREKVSMQRAGEMVTINASVAATYGNWGFVIINAGANQGVNARTKLDVKRGDDVIGTLRITNLEPNLSVCDILTVAEDSSINPGDKVAINVLTKWDPEKRAAEAAKLAPAPAPAAPAAPANQPAAGDDPFAPDPAPAAPDDDDPFGLGN
ncbi:MAG: hypothetical protein MK183_05745 [Verrucomicrobiales bacterium]|nr:hypothetical protein [Verrucomicrobiales bacterium]